MIVLFKFVDNEMYIQGFFLITYWLQVTRQIIALGVQSQFLPKKYIRLPFVKKNATNARMDILFNFNSENLKILTKMRDIIYKNESYQIIGKCIDVHNNLGPGFLEIVYKDALEYEFKKANIAYSREKEYKVNYKGIILPHKFYADFVVFGSIILEIKAVSGITDEFVAQAINYMKVSSNKLALIINFGELKLKSKRIVL